MDGACNKHERDESAEKVLVGKPEEKDHLEDLSGDGDNIKTDL
jgi:hypothetical protein